MKIDISVLLVFVSLLVVSCNTKMSQIESPLTVVIKLISAESFADFEEAKKYVDVEKVYSNNSDTLTAEQAWRTKVLFFYNLGKDKKFTNNFKYYKYHILEEQEGENATVVFQASDLEDSIRNIVCKLKMYGKRWKVVNVNYLK